MGKKIDITTFEGKYPDDMKPVVEEAHNILLNQHDVRHVAETLLLGYQLQQWAWQWMSTMKLPPLVAVHILKNTAEKAKQPFVLADLRDGVRDRALPLMSKALIEPKGRDDGYRRLSGPAPKPDG